MRIDLVFPAFPPALDGIGDYTYHLGSTLSDRHAVRVLTGQPDPDACPSVEVVRAFDPERRRGIRALSEAVSARPPDVLAVQYNPFSYGHWGFNPYLVPTLRTIRDRHPEITLAVTVHEPFVPAENWRFAVMWTWQRAQFLQLGRLADVLFFPISAWTTIFTPWFPDAAVQQLPVGSNIPRVDAPRALVRKELGMDDRLVLGLFGNAHPSRQLSTIRRALDRLHAAGHRPLLLYVGKAGGRIREALAPHDVVDAGPLPAAEVSRHFAAMDLYLSPFRKGVSARRGSFLAGIQHGVATVSTYGIHTDPMLRETEHTGVLLSPDDDPEAFLLHVQRLADDPALRARYAARGRAFFDEHFAWPHIADRMIGALAGSPTPSFALS